MLNTGEELALLNGGIQWLQRKIRGRGMVHLCFGLRPWSWVRSIVRHPLLNHEIHNSALSADHYFSAQ